VTSRIGHGFGPATIGRREIAGACGVDRINPVIDWLEGKQQHYLVWAWWTEPCGSSAYYGLITTRFDLLLAGKQAVLAGAEREAQPCRGWCPAGSGAVGSTAEARGT